MIESTGEPRDWIHYLSFRSPEDAAEAGRIVTASGTWEARDSRLISNGEWFVSFAQSNVVVNSERVDEARRFFEGIIAQFAGADYDGWEASV